jgi:hypothetical protein
MKYNFACCAKGFAGEKEKFWFQFKFEIFYSNSEVSVAHSKVTVAF